MLLRDAVLINLRRRGDKRELALEECKHLNVHPRVFFAADGAALKRSNSRITQNGNMRKKLHLTWDGRLQRETRVVNGGHSLGTAWCILGCQMSHGRVLAKPFSEPYRLVLEDAVVVPPGTSSLVRAALNFLEQRHPSWQLLLLGGASMPHWAPQTRNRLVAPILCPGLLFAEFVYLPHAYIIKAPAAKLVRISLRSGSPADNALINYMRNNVGKCFWINAVTQRPQVQSDIRASGQGCRAAAPLVTARGEKSKRKLKEKLPQCKRTTSRAKRSWLAAARRCMKRAAPKNKARGRGSTTQCMARWAVCSRGQAKMPFSAALGNRIEERWGQRKALCLSCQRQYCERLGMC